MSGSSVYNPSSSNLAQQNQTFGNLSGQVAQSLNGYAPQVSQQAQGITSQYLNNPYVSQQQTGANAASGYGTGTVVPQLQQAAGAQQGAGIQALQTGFDPQNALYARQFQQQQDQQNAVNAQSGVSGTPYAAGLTGQANQNFNLDWLNNQLQRQATAEGTANQAFTGAQNAGTGAINTQVAASGLPSSTYQQNLTNDISALQGQNSAVGGATGLDQQAMQQILSYLGYGSNAQAQNAQAQNSALAGIGQLIGGIGGLAGGLGGGDILGGLFGGGSQSFLNPISVTPNQITGQY